MLMDLGSTGNSIHFTPALGLETLSLNVLLCDPRYKVQRASVTLSSGKLSANTLPGLPLLGNFPEDVANELFSEALFSVVAENSLKGPPLTPISMSLFTGELNGTGPLRPLPLNVINENMNRALKSAAKAYLIEYNSSGVFSVPGYTPWKQTATVQYPQIA